MTEDSNALMQRLFNDTHTALNKAISDKIEAYAVKHKLSPALIAKRFAHVITQEPSPHILEAGKVERAIKNRNKNKTVIVLRYRIYQRTIGTDIDQYLRVGFQVVDGEEQFEQIQVTENETI